MVSRDMAASKESHRSFDISFKIHAVQVAEETSKSNASHFITSMLTKVPQNFLRWIVACVLRFCHLSLTIRRIYPSSLSAGSISPINGDMVAIKMLFFLSVSISVGGANTC